MNQILEKISEIINTNIKEYLPDVSPKELEKGGKIYYMNGKNGTEFDWYVNEHLPAFMVFYNDKTNLGAAKALIYDAGDILLYIYGDHGNTTVKEIRTGIDVTKDEMFRLAVTLRNNADDKRIWDYAIDKIKTDKEPSDKDIAEFNNNHQYYESMIRTRDMMGKLAVVSKRITEEGYLVGYMSCDEPHDEEDSGWAFYAGNEDDAYVDDINNMTLMPVGNVANLDPLIMKYIDSPAGTNLVRKSADEFEEDKGQDPFVSKS